MSNELILAALSDNAVSNFNTASGMDAGKIAALIGDLTTALIWVCGLWVLVVAIRSWVKGEYEEGEVFWIMARIAIVIVGMTALLSTPL